MISLKRLNRSLISWRKRTISKKEGQIAMLRSVEAVTAFRLAAVKDGWTQKRLYSNETLTRAFKLTRDGYVIQGIARPGPHGDLHCWGPDGLAINLPMTYPDFVFFKDMLRHCNNCGKKDVDTVRYSFAGRCCNECLPEMRRIHEGPGWCD